MERSLQSMDNSLKEAKEVINLTLEENASMSKIIEMMQGSIKQSQEVFATVSVAELKAVPLKF